MLHSLLSPRDAEKLIIAFARARNVTSVSEEEAQKVLDWATDAKLNFDLLTFVLNGTLLVDWKDEQPVFKNATPKNELN